MSWPPRWNQRRERGFGNPDRAFHRMLEDVFGEPSELIGGGSELPRTDLRETEESYILTMELPGISTDEVDVSVAGETLTVCGDRKRESEPRDAWHLSERVCGLFRRTVRFPRPIDPEQVDAEMHHGLLTVRVGKPAQVRGRQVKVET